MNITTADLKATARVAVGLAAILVPLLIYSLWQPMILKAVIIALSLLAVILWPVSRMTDSMLSAHLPAPAHPSPTATPATSCPLAAPAPSPTPAPPTRSAPTTPRPATRSAPTPAPAPVASPPSGPIEVYSYSYDAVLGGYVVERGGPGGHFVGVLSGTKLTPDLSTADYRATHGASGPVKHREVPYPIGGGGDSKKSKMFEVTS